MISNEVKVIGKYYGKTVEGMFNPKTFAIQYNGVIYGTPSGAGIQAIKDLGGHENVTINGWTFEIRHQAPVKVFILMS